MIKFLKKIQNRYLNSGQRSKEAIKNIFLSLFTRAANIIAHLLVVPLTINYLNPERYGIWLTLSSIISWVAFFDLGLSNGFRNRFAEAKAHGDIELAREYVSTTYAVVGLISFILMIIILALNYLVFDWSSILNVSLGYRDELTFVFAVVIIFTCVGMVANIFASLLNADQKVGYASIIQAIGQYISLLMIYILSKVSDGSLTSLSLYYSGVPSLFMLTVSFILFTTSRYKVYRPSFSKVRFSLTKSILNLGAQFFIIQLCMLAVFQVVNIIISRELGPEAVTEYNVANKYFNVIYMTVTIIITPFWSAFTDAFAKKDYKWMKLTYNRLLRLVYASVLVYIIMIFAAPTLYKIWIGSSISISFGVTVSMAVFALSQTYCAVNSYIVNGIGAVRIQAIIFALFAISSWYFLKVSCGIGLEGVILYTALVYFIIGLFEQIQINKNLNGTATGIWVK